MSSEKKSSPAAAGIAQERKTFTDDLAAWQKQISVKDAALKKNPVQLDSQVRKHLNPH